MRRIERINLIWILFYFYVNFFLQDHGTEAAVSTCGGRLTGNSGTFTSPNYPDPPKDHGQLTCTWEVIVPLGKGIQLKFGHFDMNDDGTDCKGGEIEFFSGIGKNKRSIDKYCSGDIPPNVTQSGNKLTVVFRRPKSFTGTGFLISYIATTPNQGIDDFITCTEMSESEKDVGLFSNVCPKGCGNIESHHVYGDLRYREKGTHLCRAAVHAGVISDDFGGRVNIKKVRGESRLPVSSNANNITSNGGSIGDYILKFPDADECRSDIKLKPEQYTASSYRNITYENKIHSMTPQKGIFEGLKDAWAPDINDKKPWLQISLKKVMNITGIKTTGSERPYTTVYNFTIAYSNNNIKFYPYAETNHSFPKIFNNVKLYKPTRNNFIMPTIVTRYLRIYPHDIKNAYMKTGLKLGLTGCDKTPGTVTPIHNLVHDSVDEESTTPSPQPEKNSKNSSGPSGSATQPEKDDLQINSDVTTSKIGADSVPGLNMDKTTKTTTTSTTTTTTPFPSSFLDEKVFIIAIVAIFSVISTFLAALVLYLVRKRKKDLSLHTPVPKGHSQNNATYNSSIGINSLSYNDNNNSQKKKSKSVKKEASPSLDFLNANFKDTLNVSDNRSENLLVNSRGGVTLQYGREQSNHTALPRRSSLPARNIHTTRNGGEEGAGLENKLYDGNIGGNFQRDGDEHEYQVILDPVKEYDSLDRNSSSKLSIASSGHKEMGRERRAFSSFAPVESNNVTRSKRPGTVPHKIHYFAKEEEIEPFIPPQDLERNSQLKSNGNPFSSGSNLSNSQQRNSFSSDSSSQRSHNEPLSSFFPPNNLPPKQNRKLTDVFDSPFSPTENYRGRKPSYNVPTSFPLTENPNSSTTKNNFSDTNRLSTFSNGQSNAENRHTDSRSESFNQARLRSGYDHLYKGSIKGSDRTNSVPVSPTNDYNELKLNSPV